jgi:small basic protein
MTQPMTNESLAKYELWGQTLQANIAAMQRQRRMFHIMFFGAAVLSAIGFFFGVWLGVGTFFTGIMVCGAGLYITMTRTWEYQRELKTVREEVARIAGGR